MAGIRLRGSRPRKPLKSGRCAATAVVLDLHYAFRTDSTLSPADAAACLTDSLPVRICASMLRRILPFSTLTQFLAVGTNQLRAAARSLILDAFVSDVLFGMLPIACSAFSDCVLVYAAIQSTASDLLAPIGTARSEPPRKPGMTRPFVWLGTTNWPVTPVYCLPTQQLNHAGPMIDAAWPCA